MGCGSWSKRGEREISPASTTVVTTKSDDEAETEKLDANTLNLDTCLPEKVGSDDAQLQPSAENNFAQENGLQDSSLPQVQSCVVTADAPESKEAGGGHDGSWSCSSTSMISSASAYNAVIATLAPIVPSSGSDSRPCGSGVSGRSSKNSPKRQKKAKNKQDFLSIMPEIEADVQYRFTFVVVGEDAEKLVETACFSAEAKKHGHGRGSTNESLAGSPYVSEAFASEATNQFISEPSAASRLCGAEDDHPEVFRVTSSVSQTSQYSMKHPQLFRCMCPVPYPWGKLTKDETSKYAKLAFKPLDFDQSIPSSQSSLEAASCALVFVICVDPGSDVTSLDNQLQSMLGVLKKRRKISRDLRAVWAVVLYRRSEACEETETKQECWEPWASAIESFEQSYGAMWRFGAFGLHDADKLYQTFAKIASQRIYANDNPESQCQSPMVSEWPDDSTSQSTPNILYGAEKDDVSDSNISNLYGAEAEPSNLYGAEAEADEFGGVVPGMLS
jgi:hypothetical protein